MLKGLGKGKLKEKDFIAQVKEYQGGEMSDTDIKSAKLRYKSLTEGHQRMVQPRLDAFLRTLAIKRAANLEKGQKQI